MMKVSYMYDDNHFKYFKPFIFSFKYKILP
jgi:hypothetical protein